MLAEQPSLFDEENIRRMTHRHALSTEVDAARAIKRQASELQRAVIEVFHTHGSMTDRELERLPQFATRAPSTIRKRRSELFQSGQLRPVGKRDGLTLWELVDPRPTI